MKKKFFWVLSLVLICSSFLFACSPINLTGGPSSNASVYGNGGAAVVKGEYLYFSNAYLDYNELGVNDNQYDKNSKQKIYGIYRIKLNELGIVDVDENGLPKGAELMVPLVGGYSKSGLYICGDYLYYTTPYSRDIKGENETTKGFIRFEKVRLNGKDRIILSNDGEFTTDCEYNINFIDGTAYITILQGENLTVIKSQGGNHSKSTFESPVSTMKTYNQENFIFDKDIDSVNKFIYYTRKLDNKYFLYKRSFNNNNEQILIDGSSEEIKLVCVKNNRVYYTKDSYLFSNTFKSGDLEKQYSSFKITESDAHSIVDYVILDDTVGSVTNDRGIFAVYYDGTNYLASIFNGLNDNVSIESSFEMSTQFNVLFSQGNQIFYQYSSDIEDKYSAAALYSFDFETKKHNLVVSSFNDSIDDTNSSFDYDNERIFFFGNVEKSNKNLNYLQIGLLDGGAYFDDNNSSVANLIGFLDQSDVLKEE